VTFSPPVEKLDNPGFELIGGRFDYLDRQKSGRAGLQTPWPRCQPVHLAGSQGNRISRP
jgi:hypothetical protein